MTEQQMPLERLIAGWMADEAAGAPVAHLEEILRTTGRTSPRPRIVALIAEPTVRGRASRAAVGLPNRGLVLAAIAVLLIAALTAIAVGAYLLLQPKPPESADWSGFRGGADRTGVGLVGPTGKPAVAWQFHAPGGVLEGALIGGRASSASDDGTVQAVSRDRGILQWNVHVADPPLTGPYAAD